MNLLARVIWGKSCSHVISGSQKGKFCMVRFVQFILVVVRNVDVKIFGRTGRSLGVQNLLDGLLT